MNREINPFPGRSLVTVPKRVPSSRYRSNVSTDAADPVLATATADWIEPIEPLAPATSVYIRRALALIAGTPASDRITLPSRYVNTRLAVGVAVPPEGMIR